MQGAFEPTWASLGQCCNLLQQVHAGQPAAPQKPGWAGWVASLPESLGKPTQLPWQVCHVVKKDAVAS